ncbi:hypothetical protein RclHR1_06040002 [Rhizophagus clarus]|uniref:Restriction endonuclease domain-containing protein n=1 Tax=Rhizophagus clarus TaxID=94130 RepID=A0A2Z6RS79_9GLOM|nr:hypothetical protein RclHR1_06040002 [Rhizophagus clarus]GET04930.1 hypothetical protein GLOIN_2v1475242 [Rhizophagus clarus]
MFQNLKRKVDEKFKIPKLPKGPIGLDNLPISIGQNISVKNYHHFLDNNESSGYKFEYNDGEVSIVDMSLREHAATVSLLQRYFNLPNGNTIWNPTIDVSGDDFHFSPAGNGVRIAADIAVYPSMSYVPKPPTPGLGPPPSDIRGNPHARIMCEVASGQSAANWKNKCSLWMTQPYVRCVLGIKLYELRTTRDPQGRFNRRMKAKLWRQGMASQKWEFGTVQKRNNNPTGCVALGNPAYQVTIPISDLFYDPQIPGIYTPPITFPRPAFMYGNFTIDLYHIQQKVLEVQEE